MFSLPLVRAEANCASADAPLTGDNCCRRRNLLVRGNLKLGPDLLAFSLLAGLPSTGGTCPGASDACLADCYARGGNFCWPAVRSQHEANLAASRRPDFVRRMVAELNRRFARVLRWHVAGDVYSVGYARRLLDIVRATPDVTHYLYSRSWRVRRIRPALLLLAAEPNVRCWLSCDRSTGLPRFPLPPGVRCCWMMTDPEEERTHAAEIAACSLVFRTRRCRRSRRVTIGDTLVCPVENGAGRRTNCGSCGICWR